MRRMIRGQPDHQSRRVQPFKVFAEHLLYVRALYIRALDYFPADKPFYVVNRFKGIARIRMT